VAGPWTWVAVKDRGAKDTDEENNSKSLTLSTMAVGHAGW